jgi:hypothetical protein
MTSYGIAVALGIDPSEISKYLSSYIMRGILRPAGFSVVPANRPGPRKSKLYACLKKPD